VPKLFCPDFLPRKISDAGVNCSVKVALRRFSVVSTMKYGCFMLPSARNTVSASPADKRANDCSDTRGDGNAGTRLQGMWNHFWIDT